MGETGSWRPMPKCQPWSVVPILEGAHTPCWGHTEIVGETPGGGSAPAQILLPQPGLAFSLGPRGRSARSHSQSS